VSIQSFRPAFRRPAPCTHQEELGDLDAFLQLVNRVELALARVEVDAGQHLRRLRPRFLRLIHGRHRLADDGHLRAKRRTT
jgi:hypothetical protein